MTNVWKFGDDSFAWHVKNRDGRVIQHGQCQSHDMAFRAARNWLRHHQNEVFG